jgi:nicotinamidase-related amidase
LRDRALDPRRLTPRLHHWSIPDREVARHESRRGRRHAYETLTPARTALVVIDMVPFFLAQSETAQGIVPTVNALATALRSAGGVVAWVVPGLPRQPAWAEAFYGPEVAATYGASGGTGPAPDRLWPGLARDAADLVVEKSGASAFFPGNSTLPADLAARGVNTVLIAGTVTNVCCESSARDAAALGLRVVFLADGTAAPTDTIHNATLVTIYRSFGDVRPVAEVIGMLGAAQHRAGAGRPS